MHSDKKITKIKFEKDTESSAHICPRGYRAKKENPERSMSSDIENTFDFLGSQYKSDLDEDYSEKEDLIKNKKFYAKDINKPFALKSIPKAEV